MEGSLGGWSVDVCSSSQFGLTALHLSAEEGHMDVVKELLERGADVEATTFPMYMVPGLGLEQL